MHLMAKKSYDNCFQFIFTYIINSNAKDAVKTHLISIVFFLKYKAWIRFQSNVLHCYCTSYNNHSEIIDINF